MAHENGLEDDIVSEYDVLLDSTLGTELHVVQYPLRPKTRPYDTSLVREVRFKPKQQILEMDFEIKKDGSYDFKASSEKLIDTFTLRSTVVPLKTRYGVGHISNGVVHLTPLLRAEGSVLQMRPSFDYLSKSKAEEKPSTTTAEATTTSSSISPFSSTTTSNVEEVVQVQFRKRESEQAQAARQRSHAYLRELEEQEEWITLQFVSADASDPSTSCTSSASST